MPSADADAEALREEQNLLHEGGGGELMVKEKFNLGTRTCGRTNGREGQFTAERREREKEEEIRQCRVSCYNGTKPMQWGPPAKETLL